MGQRLSAQSIECLIINAVTLQGTPPILEKTRTKVYVPIIIFLIQCACLPVCAGGSLGMKNMEHLPLTPSLSEKIPNQFVCNVPERLGNGGVRLDRFSSGIHLLHMDISLIKQEIVLAESPAGYCGISFNLTGKSRTGLKILAVLLDFSRFKHPLWQYRPFPCKRRDFA